MKSSVAIIKYSFSKNEKRSVKRGY